MNFVVFILLLNLVLALINLRAYRWLTRAFVFGPRLRLVLILVQVGSFALSGIGRWLSRAGYEFPIPSLLVLALGIQLALIMSVVLLLVLDLASASRRLLLRLLAFVGSRRSAGTGRAALQTPLQPSQSSEPSAGSEAQQQPPAAARTMNTALEPPAAAALEEKPADGLSRRKFALQVAVGSTFLVAGASSTYGALVGRHDYVLEDVPIRIAGLNRALDGFSIVQLSDLHIGQFVGEPELRAAEALVRSAKPDLIVLTGDLIDHDPRFSSALGRFVRRLEPLAREGVVVISGNHDYYAGIDATLAAVRGGGARVLENEGMLIGKGDAALALLGVNDVRADQFGQPGPDLMRAVQSLSRAGGKLGNVRDLPRVLLCHNPVFFESAQHDVALQLSGHTHGGQVNLLVRPADWVLRHGWVAGHYRAGAAQLYVNRGFGTVGPPARLGAPPEVSRIILTV